MSTDAPRPSFLRRYLTPIIIVLVTAGLLVLNSQIELIPQFGHSGTVVLYQYLTVLGIGLLLVWFFCSREFGRRTKTMAFLVVAILGLVGAGAWATLVRKVEITGDNVPIVYFRWDELPGEAVLETSSNPKSGTFELRPDAPSCPGFLGPKRDSEVPGPALATDWTTEAPRELWRRPVGLGYAAFAVTGGLAITIEQRGPDEAVVAYDGNTGEEIWSRHYPGFFQERLGGDGPRATPTIDGDSVYTLGATGTLVALSLADGSERWKIDILKDNDATNVTWGMCGSPWIDGDRVLVNPGGSNGKALVAYDKVTGARLGCGGSAAAAYASPMLGSVGGSEQILLFDSFGVHGFDRDSLRELWKAHFESFQNINVGQPVVVDADHVLVSAGYGSGAALVKIEKTGDEWKATDVWRNKNLKCKFGSPLFYDGYVYGLDDGILVCIDPKTGKRQWKKGRYGHGQILRRDDVLVVMAEDGDVVLVAADPTKHRELARMHALDGGKTWNAPALAGNRLYVRNHLEAACYELPLAKSP